MAGGSRDLAGAFRHRVLELTVVWSGGMVAKRADILYVSGRSKHWLKVKTRVGIEQMQSRIESWGPR